MKHNTIKEMHEILNAIEQGKEVQYQHVGTKAANEWFDAANKQPNFKEYTYRIKPKKEWRPFENVDEFIRSAGGLGAIWLKRKADNEMLLITAMGTRDSDDPIRLISSWVSFSDIFEHFTFVDGRPCGVEEDA